MERFSETPIQQALSAVGFIRVRRFVYVSTPARVRHFLWFERWGPSKRYLSAVYGFGNAEADSFVWQCLSKYGGHLYGYRDSHEVAEPPLRFALGGIVGWEPSGSIDLAECKQEALTFRISASIEVHVLPLIARLSSSNALLRFLRSDEGRFSWTYTNGAVRAAQIAYLGAKSGKSSSDLGEVLQPFTRNIQAQITGMDAVEFIHRIVADALGRNKVHGT